MVFRHVGFSLDFLLLTCLTRGVTAQYQFLVPESSVADFTESWTIGDTMNISWSKGWHGVGKELSSADLWVTWFRTDSFSQLVLEDVIFDNAGSLQWEVNVSRAVVETDTQFVLRLKPHSNPPVYTSTENESPSRGFYIVAGAETEVSSYSISPTSSIPNSTWTSTSSHRTRSTTRRAVSTTATPQQNNYPTGLHPGYIGAIVGGVVGGLVLLCFVAVLGFQLAKLAKRKREERVRVAELDNGGVCVSDGYLAYKSRMAAVEIEGREKPVELGIESGRVHEVP